MRCHLFIKHQDTPNPALTCTICCQSVEVPLIQCLPTVHRWSTMYNTTNDSSVSWLHFNSMLPILDFSMTTGWLGVEGIAAHMAWLCTKACSTYCGRNVVLNKENHDFVIITYLSATYRAECMFDESRNTGSSTLVAFHNQRHCYSVYHYHISVCCQPRPAPVSQDKHRHASDLCLLGSDNWGHRHCVKKATYSTSQLYAQCTVTDTAHQHCVMKTTPANKF